MPRILSYLSIVAMAALLIGAPIAFFYHHQTQMRNFRVVRDGVLYRSGQMTIAGLKRAINDHGIKTVITLRDAYFAGDTPRNIEEENFCKAEEINYFRITPKRWWTQDGSIPAEKGVQKFLEIMDDPANFPVLIHCFAGIHRTGAFCAIYRMEYEGWNNPAAIEEMKTCGYINLDDEWDVLAYLEQYHPRLRGLVLKGKEPVNVVPAQLVKQSKKNNK